MSSRRFIAPSLGLIFAGAAVPLQAQQSQRVEVTTPRRTASPDEERQLRSMRHQIDSLTFIYNEQEDLGVVERRKLVQSLNSLVVRYMDIRARLANGDGKTEYVFRIAPQAEGGARAGSMSRGMVELQAAQAMAKTTGWLGFVAYGPSITTRSDEGETIVRFMAYPRIISVEASSPAMTAGIVPGDTLLAYDARDVLENEISMTKLLRPGAKVSVRLRRDGRVREVPVTVAAAPQRILVRRDEEARGTPWAIAGVPDAPSFPRAGGAPPAPAAVLRGAVAPRAPGDMLPSASSMAPTVYLRQGSPLTLANGIAGAQIASIAPGSGLAKMTGLDAGVLISTVPTGSLAADAGLTDGDVVVRAGARVIRDVTQLREAVGYASASGERAIELEIVRDHKSQKIILKW
jgi:C-terminal processing protease CtpA/Prc